MTFENDEVTVTVSTPVQYTVEVLPGVPDAGDEADARLDVIEESHGGMSHVLLLAEADPIPDGTPSGTIIVRY